jgi:DNA-binding Lrp family transcriptional regulator
VGNNEIPRLLRNRIWREVTSMKAYLLIETRPGTSEDVVKAIKMRFQNVLHADSVYGRHDVIVVLEAPDLETLNEFVYKVIEKDPNIVHTETSITLF